MSKRSLVIIAVVWLVVLVAGISSAVTMRISGADQGWSLELPSAGGVYVSEDEYETLRRYSRLEEVRQTLETQYYLPVDEETLLTGAVRGMMDSLGDRYTFYYTVDEMTEMQQNATGEYKGIGVTVAADEQGNIVMLRVFSNTPARSVGIEEGDVLIAVNGQSVSGESEQGVDDAVQLIAACGDDEFSLTLLRKGEEYSVQLRRENVTMDRVQYAVLDGNIGYIQITDFLGNDVEGVREAMASFEKANLQGLIIDLRNNTGGYLDDVVQIADILLPEGLIVYTEDRQGNRLEEHSDANCVDYPVVCLVNSMSASASEVLSGAVQDYGIGAIIGETTFGKGIVQTVWTFEDGAGMQLTTATYYTPAGRCIHGTGIEPDYEIVDDPQTEEDEALEFARKWLCEGANSAGEEIAE